MKSLTLSFYLFLGSIQFSFGQCSTTVLEGFGSVSAIAVYNTYITIGSVADGYVGEVFEADYVVTLMDEQKSMISVVKESLNACVNDQSEGKLDQDDKNYLQELTLCLSYLEAEADGLLNFASSGSEEALDKYSENRDKAWELLESLLGLEE